jgi:hypothetical protein
VLFIVFSFSLSCGTLNKPREREREREGSNGEQHLQRCLPANLCANQVPMSNFVTCCWRGTPLAWAVSCSWWGLLGVSSGLCLLVYQECLGFWSKIRSSCFFLFVVVVIFVFVCFCGILNV